MSCNTDHKAQSKDIIACEALKLFVGKGYHNTSIPDIVQAAGLSTGAVYHHFGSKEHLAKYIHEIASARFAEKFRALVFTKPSFKEQVSAFVHMMLEWDDEDPVLVKYLITDRPAEVLNRKTTVCSENGMTLIGEMVNRGMMRQEVTTDNNFIAISIISGAIIYFINLKKDGFLHGDLGRRADELAEHIMKALC
jgi:AcrR family transcriptional regulator